MISKVWVVRKEGMVIYTGQVWGGGGGGGGGWEGREEECETHCLHNLAKYAA